MSYRLGIDLGTTSTSAAVLTSDGPSVDGSGGRVLRVPSVVFVTPDGDVLFGDEAERRGDAEPDRAVRDVKRLIGQPSPILVAGSAYWPASLQARLLAWVVDQVSQREGSAPDRVTLTYSGSWGDPPRELLEQTIAMSGLPRSRVDLCPDAAASATFYAARNPVAMGDCLAVYDFGGGAFEAAIVRRSPAGFELLGPPIGIENLGGVDFDLAVFNHGMTTLGDAMSRVTRGPAATAGLARLRRECRRAKEALSRDPETSIAVTLPGLTTSIRLDRAQFEAMIQVPVAATVDAMGRAIHSAGIQSADLTGVILAGGSSQIPLVRRELERAFGRPLTSATQANEGIALGAAMYRPPQGPPSPPTPPVPATSGGWASAPPPPPPSASPYGIAPRPPSRRRPALLALLIGVPIVLIGAILVAVLLHRSSPASDTAAQGPGQTLPTRTLPSTPNPTHVKRTPHVSPPPVTVTGDPISIGTTDAVVNLDPAGAYDEGSWTLQYNLFQTLLTVPSGGNRPVGDAARICGYTDPTTFTCTLRAGLRFSNGDPLTSLDVKDSIERVITIADPNGASTLLASVATLADDGSLSVNPDAIETPNASTVIFHLNKPDATFRHVLTTPATDIVDHRVYPAGQELQQTEVVGSGPYLLDSYSPGETAVFSPNPMYIGPNPVQAPQITVTYYTDTASLTQAIRNGSVDIAWRSLAPEDVQTLAADTDLTVVRGQGSEIRYWVWRTQGAAGKQLAVRQAAAYLINRSAIAGSAYSGTVRPLYSIVPPGLPGHVDSFMAAYGATPDVAKATALLQQAGVATPIHITLGYTPTHYGTHAVDEAKEFKSQLESGGLFSVTLKSAEFTQYSDLYRSGAYDLFMLGWFPDYEDADDFLAPFMVDGGFFDNGYSNPAATTLVHDEEGSTDPVQRASDFVKLQNIAAHDVPFIPSWVGDNVAVYGPGVKGVEQTLDPSFIFRFWELTKNAGS